MQQLQRPGVVCSQYFSKNSRDSQRFVTTEERFCSALFGRVTLLVERLEAVRVWESSYRPLPSLVWVRALAESRLDTSGTERSCGDSFIVASRLTRWRPLWLFQLWRFANTEKDAACT